MGVLVGFAVGYYLGTRRGALSIEELAENWRSIQANDEFQALKASATGMAKDAVAKGIQACEDAERQELMRAVVGGGVSLLARRLAA